MAPGHTPEGLGIAAARRLYSLGKLLHGTGRDDEIVAEAADVIDAIAALGEPPAAPAQLERDKFGELPYAEVLDRLTPLIHNQEFAKAADILREVANSKLYKSNWLCGCYVCGKAAQPKERHHVLFCEEHFREITNRFRLDFTAAPSGTGEAAAPAQEETR
jgi:hypothetical protein